MLRVASGRPPAAAAMHSGEKEMHPGYGENVKVVKSFSNWLCDI
jgi:hypothetical protein